jgi:large subunit ribosomal protein L6
MSRIGKLPITIPAGVQVSVVNDVVTVSGKLGTLSQKLTSGISINIEGNTLTVVRPNEEKQTRAAHGLYRALINNMANGVSKGYSVAQELVGVGYRAANTGNLLELTLGYSHNITFDLPKEISVETKTERGKNPIITLTSFDKQLLGAVAAKIRSLRTPEPYKGKGVRFVGEQLRRKAGKSAGKK